MIKVMIADDQELIRQSLQIVLSTHEDLKVVDAVENGFAVLESIKKRKAGCYFNGYSYARNGRCLLYKGCQREISRY